MGEVAIIEPRSVLVDVAHSYGMEPAAFEATVRATCSPTGRDAKPLTREEFAAFLLVAKNYSLNPLLKEIYPYPKKGGGIIPVVAVDGWLNLINSHPKCDGFDLEAGYNAKGDLDSFTCRMYRKDRTHPTIVTEYLSECRRDTEPWKMKHRMLRHKALIQCARYAFGFAGIYDEDEGELIAEAVERPAAPAKRIPPPAPKPEQIEAKPAATIDTTPESAKEVAPVEQPRKTPPPASKPAAPTAPKAEAPATYAENSPAFFKRFAERCAQAKDFDALQEVWLAMIDPITDDMDSVDFEEAQGIMRDNERRLDS